MKTTNSKAKDEGLTYAGKVAKLAEMWRFTDEGMKVMSLLISCAVMAEAGYAASAKRAAKDIERIITNRPF